MKTKLWLLATVLAGFTWSAAAVDDIAVVNDNRVNVRGQATLNSEIITQLKKGEKVTILEEIAVPKPKKGEPAKWYRIALPANTPVWVNAAFVKDNVVTVNKLNVRTGPGENFSVIARLEKGAALKEIRTVGEWKEVEAPGNASAYVAADLLMRQESALEKPVLAKKDAPEAGKKKGKAAKAAPAKPAPPENVTVETVKVDTTPAPVPAKTEAPALTAKPVTRPVEVASIPAPAPVVAAPAPSAKAEPLSDPAVPTKAEPEPKKGFFSRVFGKGSRTNSTEKAKVASKEKTDALAAKVAEIDAEPPPPRIVTREGVVKRSYNIQTPSYHQLESTDTGKVINYLYTTNTNLPWKALYGRVVVVTGQEAIDKRWPNTPVLTIETLKTPETQ